MVRNFRRSGQEPDLSLMSQGQDAYLVLRGVFHVSPPALGACPLTASSLVGIEILDDVVVIDGELAAQHSQFPW